MQLISELIKRLDIDRAAGDAATRGNDFFPSRVALRAANTYPEYRTALRRKWRTDFSLESAESVPVPKYGGATRPGTDLDAESRLLFDALCIRLAEVLPAGLVNRSLHGSARTKAEDALSRGKHSHVLVTDIVAFYEYIDREVLESELADLTGEADLVEAIGDVMRAVMPATRGIPQGTPTAEVLADAYLSIADRRVARAGIPVVRWADDYRFAATSLKQATRTQGALEVELRALGLVLSSGKTWTPTRARYAKWIKAQRAERTALDDLLAVIREASDYTPTEEEDGSGDGDVLRPDPSLETAFLEATEDKAPWGSSPDAFAAGSRIRGSLRELGRTGSRAPLDRLTTLLFRWPHLTRQTATYLRARIHSGSDGDVVEALTETIVKDDYPYVWQLGWLLHALIPAQQHLPAAAIDFARGCLYDVELPGFVRGRAALVLGTEHQLPLGQDLSTLFDVLPSATKPDFLAAATLMPEDPSTEAFLRAARRDPLLAQVEKVVETANVYYL